MYEVTVVCAKCQRENRVLIPSQTPSHFQCNGCHGTILTVIPIQGFVYILSNEAMLGLVKIGFTTREVAERIAELNSMTGVPAPFVLEAYFTSSSPLSDETTVHTKMASLRLTNKEFFKCSVDDAIEAVRTVLERAPVFVLGKLQVTNGQRLSSPESYVHNFQDGKCTKCGYREEAIRQNNWSCSAIISFDR